MHHFQAVTSPEQTYPPTEHSYSPYFYSQCGLRPLMDDLLYSLTPGAQATGYCTLWVGEAWLGIPMPTGQTTH